MTNQARLDSTYLLYIQRVRSIKSLFSTFYIATANRFKIAIFAKNFFSQHFYQKLVAKDTKGTNKLRTQTL